MNQGEQGGRPRERETHRESSISSINGVLRIIQMTELKIRKTRKVNETESWILKFVQNL